MKNFLVGMAILCLVLLVVFEASFFYGAADRRLNKINTTAAQ